MKKSLKEVYAQAAFMEEELGEEARGLVAQLESQAAPVPPNVEVQQVKSLKEIYAEAAFWQEEFEAAGLLSKDAPVPQNSATTTTSPSSKPTDSTPTEPPSKP